MTYDDVDGFVEPYGDHSNILKKETPEERWRSLYFGLFRGPQQHFEIVKFKLLILARTNEKNEAVAAGPNRRTLKN